MSGDDRMSDLTSEWRTCCRTKVHDFHSFDCKLGLTGMAQAATAATNAFGDLRRQAGVSLPPQPSLLRLASEVNEAALAFREMPYEVPLEVVLALSTLLSAVDRLTGAIVEAENDG